ncbi:uncharacterized protein BDZ99DRAFT_25605 [Mytilinidion resinicola]|uniref:Uncharacterized protein n=1 Tax=Mytilinidion resinicola TaxID=574789 RepID=A0A6A6YMR3_9PEZI|nr:uncharacterized protein BDZ99DRAFT_25605 [Mytilinidion resinicola]KAF2809265.1 hypothetical protein BDZ99DRAFT_25605 [Mytilinidion resinicola]
MSFGLEYDCLLTSGGSLCQAWRCQPRIMQLRTTAAWSHQQIWSSSTQLVVFPLYFSSWFRLNRPTGGLGAFQRTQDNNHRIKLPRSQKSWHLFHSASCPHLRASKKKLCVFVLRYFPRSCPPWLFMKFSKRSKCGFRTCPQAFHVIVLIDCPR